MAYRRRFKRRRRYRRKSYRRRGVSRRYVKSAIGRQIETKVHRVYSDTISPSPTVTRLIWSEIDQGVSAEQRIGARIKLRKIRMNMFARVATSDATNKILLVVIQMRRDLDPSDGSTWPAWTDIVPGYTGSSVGDWILQPGLNTPDWKVLMWKHFALNTQYVAEKFSRKTFTSKRLNDLHWKDRSGSSAIAKGHILTYCISDSGAIPYPELLIHMDMYYKDA